MKKVAFLVVILLAAGFARAEFVEEASCGFELDDVMDLTFYYPSFAVAGGAPVLSGDAAFGAKSILLTSGSKLKNVDGKIGSLLDCTVDFYLYMPTDVNTGSNITANDVDFMDSGGLIFGGLAFMPDGSGTGTFSLRMFSNVPGWYTGICSGIPINSWEHLKVRCQLTDTVLARPAGVITVWRELAGSWQLISQRSFTSVSDFSTSPNPKAIARCQFSANDISWNIDEFKIGFETDNVSIINPNMPMSVSFTDNFESGSLAEYQGSIGTWAVLSTDQAVSPTHSVAITDNGGSDYLAKPITQVQETWVDFQFMVKSGGPGTTDPGSGLYFKGIGSDASYKVPVAVTYKLEGSGYGLYMLDGHAGYYTQLATNLPLDTWKRLKVGVRRVSTANGLLWVYIYNSGSWQTIVSGKGYVSLQPLDTGFDLIQFTAGGSNIAIDDLTIGKPLYCGMSGTAYNSGDVNKDCYVDMNDFAEMAVKWLTCTDPANTNCN